MIHPEPVMYVAAISRKEQREDDEHAESLRNAKPT